MEFCDDGLNDWVKWHEMTHMGGVVAHTFSNIGRIMDPNFETEGHAPIHNQA